MPPHDKKRLESIRKKRLLKQLKRRKSQGGGGPRYFHKSDLLDFVRARFSPKVVPERFSGAQGPGWRIAIPKAFCFISNPNESLEVLTRVVNVSRRIKSRECIYIDHRKCEVIDIAACALLDVLVLEMRRETKCEITAFYPTNLRVKHVIQCMGITQHLKLPGTAPPREVDRTFTKFDFFSGRKALNEAFGSDQERAATRLSKYVSTCVQKMTGFLLDEAFERHILQWSGEIITNAEEHSGRDVWFTIGYMVPSTESGSPQQNIGECELAIFGFGRSIAESLQDPVKVSPSTRKEIEGLIDRHRQKQSFLLGKAFGKDELLTLFSLQDGVSSVADFTRGTGTVQIIEAFQELGATLQEGKRPEMALLSGKSRILFDGRYLMSKTGGLAGKKVIAFNPQNSLEERPDSSNVHSLDTSFPGTILTCRFFIDKNNIARFHDPVTGTVHT